MADPVLVVPMTCRALALNQGVKNRDTFRWWQFNYTSLNHFKSPEPEGTDREWGSRDPGVYLHWTLPRTLRSGIQYRRTGQIVYPLVPNRWLIVHLNGATTRQAVAWVLESDCPWTSRAKPLVDSKRTCMYLADPGLIAMWHRSSDEYRKGFQPNPDPKSPIKVATLGIPFPLNDWKERAAETMFLTAVAPSNAVFTAYYPHNMGVFSFYDDLKGIDKDTLSYYVIGWYSDPRKDVLASWPSQPNPDQAYQDLLTQLGWTVKGGSEQKARTSLYEGAVFQLSWNRTGKPPAKDPLQAIRDTGRLNAAVGNTTIDAFTSLIAVQLQAKGHKPEEVEQVVELLRAFQYDFLQTINEVNGDALLQQRIHQAWFGSRPGGYRWTIVPKESDTGTPAVLTDAEAAWLLQLNRDQAELDAALEELFDLQWRVNSLWYRRGYLSDSDNLFPDPPDGVGDLGDFMKKLSPELDPAQANSSAGRLLAKTRAVLQLLARLPQPVATGSPNPEQAFLKGIEAFAQQKGLGADKVLKAVPAPRFWRANHPVIVVSGVEPSPASDPKDAPQVRLSTHLVTGFAVGKNVAVNATTARGAIPSLGDVSGLPPAIPSLFEELFFLDPAGAAAIAAATGQSSQEVSDAILARSSYQPPLPDFDLGPWTQPWTPLFMEWVVSYSHIPDGADGTPNWTFDGTDYRFTPGGRTVVTEDRSVAGISLLSPHGAVRLRFAARRFRQEIRRQGAARRCLQMDQGDRRLEIPLPGAHGFQRAAGVA